MIINFEDIRDLLDIPPVSRANKTQMEQEFTNLALFLKGLGFHLKAKLLTIYAELCIFYGNYRFLKTYTSVMSTKLYFLSLIP
jgi:hypothetical protein